jgi:hypothetical protein
MRYKNTLLTNVQHNVRNSLIRSFQKSTGTICVLSSNHKALKWSSRGLLPLWPAVIDAPQKMISKQKKNKVVKDDSEGAQTSLVPTKGSVPVNMKCKLFTEKTSESFKNKDL